MCITQFYSLFIKKKLFNDNHNNNGIITQCTESSEFDSSNFNYGDAGIWRPRVFDEFEFKPIKPYKMGKLFSYDGAIYEGEDNFEKFISYLMYTWILEHLHNF